MREGTAYLLKGSLYIVLIITALVILLIFLISVSKGLWMEEEIKKCSSYEEDTRIDTFFQEDTGVCYVNFEDGTRVRLSDFNIAAFKDPRIAK